MLTIRRMSVQSGAPVRGRDSRPHPGLLDEKGVLHHGATFRTFTSQLRIFSGSA